MFRTSQCEDGVEVVMKIRCQGIERRKRNPNMYFIKKFRKLRTYAKIYALN